MTYGNAARGKVTGILVVASIALVGVAYLVLSDSSERAPKKMRGCPRIPHQALRPDASLEERFFALDQLALDELVARRFDQAAAFATELLNLAPQYRDTWNFGNAIHHGNTVLGRVALVRGDIHEARQRLRASAETNGSPQLDSFGPSMALAQEMLERGEVAVVLQYLERCKRFWKLGREDLARWQAEITTNRRPNFRYNACK